MVLSLPVILMFCLLLYKCLLAFGLQPNAAGRWLLPEAPPASKAPAPREWRTFRFALGIRALVLLAAVFCIMLRAQGTVSLADCLDKLTLWDARHYINLIEQGYAAYQEDGAHLFLVFFPGYVWLVRAVALLIPHTALAGMLLSAVCFSWGCCWVHRIACERYDPQVADDAVLLLSVFPFSFFFGAVMTEGLFLLTTSAACYYALNHRWLPFAIWGVLAALTRMTGVLVILVAVIEFLEEAKPFAPPVKTSLLNAVKKFAAALPLLAAPCLGTLGYWLLNACIDGDPFAYLTHHQHWSQGGMWLSEVLRYLLAYFHANRATSLGWAVFLPELLLFAAFFGILAVSLRFRKHPVSLLVYAFCYLIANYSLAWLLSGGRYLSCGFVFFILLAALLKNRPLGRAYVAAGEAVFLGVFLFGYLSGAQIM